jgi:dihydroorotate dehydrogenase
MTVTHNTNIMPGWKIIPALLGAVEFGSFTRYPRMGNHGIVMWRDELTQSTQNRVGLKNPGIRLAAQFLAQRWAELPPIWGLNIAVTPGVTDDAQAVQEVVESITIVLQQIQPTWFTLNISCPNTEDDPSGQQTEQKTRLLCRAAVAALHEAQIPLWVKISPDLSETQYALLLRVFQEEGVAAVIATNTLAQPAPNDASVNAGVGGGKLHTAAMTAVAHLAVAKIRQQATIDIIGCGGLLNGNSYRDFKTLGVEVVQYWSALVFRGPLAAPIIESELPDVRNEPVPTTIDRASIIAN